MNSYNNRLSTFSNDFMIIHMFVILIIDHGRVSAWSLELNFILQNKGMFKLIVNAYFIKSNFRIVRKFKCKIIWRSLNYRIWKT